MDPTKDEPEDDNNNPMASFIDLTGTPAPSNRKRNAAPASSSFAVAKRRRNSQSSSRPTKTRRDYAFGYSSNFDEFIEFDPPEKPDIDGPDSIDLSNADEVPKELIAPKIDNRVKLGQFQCVICMDNVTSLTVTHCGMSRCRFAAFPCPSSPHLRSSLCRISTNSI